MLAIAGGHARQSAFSQASNLDRSARAADNSPCRAPVCQTASELVPAAYRLSASAAFVAEVLRADLAGDVWQGGEVAPGGYAPVVVSDKTKGRCLVPRQWGVPPPPRGEHVVPFVRNLESPFWIGTLRHRQFRCLVPMTHFRKGHDWLTDPAQPIVACAGIWRDSEIPSFAILTSGATGALPVILQPEAFSTWLCADIKIAGRLFAGRPGTTWSA